MLRFTLVNAFEAHLLLGVLVVGFSNDAFGFVIRQSRCFVAVVVCQGVRGVGI